MIPPVARPPVDAMWEDMPASARAEFPELQPAPMFRSARGRSRVGSPDEGGANEFGVTVVAWVIAAALGTILVGCGIWIGTVLA